MKLSRIRLLKREFLPNQLTVCQVINDEADRLTIPIQESLLRKVLRQMHFEPLELLDQGADGLLFRWKLVEPHVFVRVLHL